MIDSGTRVDGPKSIDRVRRIQLWSMTLNGSCDRSAIQVSIASIWYIRISFALQSFLRVKTTQRKSKRFRPARVESDRKRAERNPHCVSRRSGPIESAYARRVRNESVSKTHRLNGGKKPRDADPWTGLPLHNVYFKSYVRTSAQKYSEETIKVR